jgi:hypothetical protein
VLQCLIIALMHFGLALICFSLAIFVLPTFEMLIHTLSPLYVESM